MQCQVAVADDLRRSRPDEDNDEPLRGPVGCKGAAVAIAVTRTQRHKGWRRRPDDPPEGALYGAQKS